MQIENKEHSDDATFELPLASAEGDHSVDCCVENVSKLCEMHQSKRVSTKYTLRAEYVKVT